MVSANQASSVTLCYDPTMKADAKVEKKREEGNDQGNSAKNL